MYTHLYKNIYPVLICTQANSCPLSYIYPVLICCREPPGKGAGHPCDNN